VISELTTQAMAVYKEDDRSVYLDNLFRLQATAGHFEDARRTLGELQHLKKAAKPGSDIPYVRWQVYLLARSLSESQQLAFPLAFGQAFDRIIGGLDDKSAAEAALWLAGAPQSVLEKDLQDALHKAGTKNTIELKDAVDLIRNFLGVEAYSQFRPLLPALQERDDERRYILDKDVLVDTGDGGHVCVLVVRQRGRIVRLPALLNFTIYASPNTIMAEARRTAANGYVGVEGLTRGKGCSPDAPVPIEHDGSDAAKVIDWISKQSWSDGRVGMYGGSYEGFTQWAATKHMPKALKAIMPSVTFAPGIDFPMPGGIFASYGYPWPFYTTDNKTLDDKTYFDSARWDRLNQKWYTSGLPYGDLDKLDGRSNPTWDKWLSHPTYDAYWQSAIPYLHEFGQVNIPVLTTTGYYDGGQIGALYYFSQHCKYRPNAEHYFVIGPYDHVTGQRGTRGQTVLRNLNLDPVSDLDIGELRYEWFDYVFKGASKPALLKDRVNYEVMGTNVWKHAPSIEAMHTHMLKFHLTSEPAGDAFRLVTVPAKGDTYLKQAVDLADRSDVTQVSQPAAGVDSWNDDEVIVSKEVKFFNGFKFVSDPFPAPIEFSGAFMGLLDFVTNKKDFDFNIQLYEQTAAGDYVQLSYYAARASQVKDLSQRKLLIPGKREQLDFKCNVLTSRLLKTGSRLVVVLKIVKKPDQEINYGTGGKVSGESIADARLPLRIKWFTGTFVEIPVR
jgi:uncharacterized protein